MPPQAAGGIYKTQTVRGRASKPVCRRFNPGGRHQKKKSERVRQLRQDVYIDANLVPDSMWDHIASGALGLLREIESTPGGREALEKKKAEIRQKKEAVQ